MAEFQSSRDAAGARWRTLRFDDYRLLPAKSLTGLNELVDIGASEVIRMHGFVEAGQDLTCDVVPGQGVQTVVTDMPTRDAYIWYYRFMGGVNWNGPLVGLDERSIFSIITAYRYDGVYPTTGAGQFFSNHMRFSGGNSLVLVQERELDSRTQVKRLGVTTSTVRSATHTVLPGVSLQTEMLFYGGEVFISTAPFTGTFAEPGTLATPYDRIGLENRTASASAPVSVPEWAPNNGDFWELTHQFRETGTDGVLSFTRHGNKVSVFR